MHSYEHVSKCHLPKVTRFRKVGSGNFSFPAINSVRKDKYILRCHRDKLLEVSVVSVSVRTLVSTINKFVNRSSLNNKFNFKLKFVRWIIESIRNHGLFQSICYKDYFANQTITYVLGFNRRSLPVIMSEFVYLTVFLILVNNKQTKNERGIFFYSQQVTSVYAQFRYVTETVTRNILI